MGILSIIQNKKDQFRNYQTEARSKSMSAKTNELERLQKERAELEKENKIINMVANERAQVATLKKNKAKNTVAGRIMSNIKAKVQESRDKNPNPFTQPNESIFTNNTQFGNPFIEGSVGDASRFGAKNLEVKPKIKPTNKIIRYK